MSEQVHKGVGTYNKDNSNNKNNKNNMPRNNPFFSLSLGLTSDEVILPVEAKGLLSKGQEEAEPDFSQDRIQAPTPLSEDQIKGWIIQLFDNGETSTQRHKFKIRLNLTDNTNPEFIASLTKDLRNFKKHIPGAKRQEIIDMAMEERSRIKQQTGHWPYLGKLHLNQGFNSGRSQQNEPDTLVIVWWDPEERGWSGIVKIQQWAAEFDLFSDCLTAQQKKMCVKAQDSWRNPKYDTRPRPLTWAEQRQQSK